jgi:hypothetical protein
MANVAGDGDREGKKTQGDPVFSAAPPAPLLPSIAGTAANDTPKPITQFSLLCSNCLDVTIIIVFKFRVLALEYVQYKLIIIANPRLPALPINIAPDPPKWWQFVFQQLKTPTKS